MTEKILQHKHCQICGRAVPVSEDFCSDECKEKMEAITHEIQRISRITKKLGRIKQIILEDYSLKGSADSVASSLVNLDDSGKGKAS